MYKVRFITAYNYCLGGGGGGIGVLRPFSTIYAIQVLIFTHWSCIQGTERRDRIRIQSDLEFHHSRPGSLTCTEYNSDTRGRKFKSPSDGQSEENRVVALEHTAPSVVGGTRTRYPEFLSLRLYHWAIVASYCVGNDHLNAHQRLFGILSTFPYDMHLC